MHIQKCLAGALILGLALTTAVSARPKGVTVREQQEQACYNDAMTLCRDAVPDEAKITACMNAKRAQLSPACAKMFDDGTQTKKKHRG